MSRHPRECQNYALPITTDSVDCPIQFMGVFRHYELFHFSISILGLIFALLHFLGLLSTHHAVTIENKTLLPLARQLPQYLIFSRADNTVKGYMTAYRKWEKWSLTFALKTLPANPTSVALFILSQIEMDVKYSSIKGFFYGIKYIHKVNNFVDPTRHGLVASMFETAHRLCRNAVRKKLPLLSRTFNFCTKVCWKTLSLD